MSGTFEIVRVRVTLDEGDRGCWRQKEVFAPSYDRSPRYAKQVVIDVTASLLGFLEDIGGHVAPGTIDKFTTTIT
ncbi:hypothetical protein LKO27_15055, partial [Tessaracoccus sp. OS52]|uniref:hypothetical protein n=1 Tax=Tessaracoccus sp. OS52 TaxID=2886691 RepID=UPI001D12C977